MNDLLFYTLIIALLVYFLLYLPKKKSLSQSSTPLTQSTSTQTNLKDWEVDKLTNQWKQVVEWATEEGININKKWNLGMLKTKLTHQIQDLQHQLAARQNQPITVKYSRGTQTNSGPTDKSVEKTLEDLIKNIQDLNKSLN